MKKSISIHAPVWGATCENSNKQKKVIISIHAPVWGATLDLKKCFYDISYFNSRSRVGSDKAKIFSSD